MWELRIFICLKFLTQQKWHYLEAVYQKYCHLHTNSPNDRVPMKLYKKQLKMAPNYPFALRLTSFVWCIVEQLCAYFVFKLKQFKVVAVSNLCRMQLICRYVGTTGLGLHHMVKIRNFALLALLLRLNVSKRVLKSDFNTRIHATFTGIGMLHDI